MDTTTKEIESRREEIEDQLELLFKTNMKITDWDVPEADDQKAAELIVEVLQNKLNKIKEDVENRKYEFY
jgi:CRISPR/Cas system CSM-associated protein Csm2 small subunit